MTHSTFVRELAALTVASGAVVAAVMLAGPWVALLLVLVVIPILTVVLIVARELRRTINATDHYCARVDQELDARRQLRTQRTVHAEPQANVIDLFSREPVA